MPRQQGCFQSPRKESQSERGIWRQPNEAAHELPNLDGETPVSQAWAERGLGTGAARTVGRKGRFCQHHTEHGLIPLTTADKGQKAAVAKE